MGFRGSASRASGATVALVLAFALTATMLSACTSSSKPATTRSAAATIPPPTSATTSTTAAGPKGAVVNWLDVSLTLPVGWALNPRTQGSADGCAQPVEPPPGAPTWWGCAGLSIQPDSSDPAHPSFPQNPGQVWFGSTGVLPCPYPGSQANEVVLTAGDLVDQGNRTVGDVTYRWYRWSATCNLNGAPGTPVTHIFDAQVWWLPSAGIAIVDVTGHPEASSILASVRTNPSPPQTGPTTTVNPAITHPTSGIEFRSPTGNIHCEIDNGPPYPSNDAFCFSGQPLQSATLKDDGAYTTCSGATCLANPAPDEIQLPYGQSISLGAFRCTSTVDSMVCTANGKGFAISRAGIVPV